MPKPKASLDGRTALQVNNRYCSLYIPLMTACVWLSVSHLKISQWREGMRDCFHCQVNHSYNLSHLHQPLSTWTGGICYICVFFQLCNILHHYFLARKLFLKKLHPLDLSNVSYPSMIRIKQQLVKQHMMRWWPDKGRLQNLQKCPSVKLSHSQEK